MLNQLMNSDYFYPVLTSSVLLVLPLFIIVVQYIYSMSVEKRNENKKLLRKRKSFKINKHEYLSMEEMKELVADRKILIQRSYLDGFGVLFSFRSTILNMITRDPIFWCTIVLYISVRWIFFRNPTLPLLPMPPVSAMGGFTSFLLVFYASQTYTRFLSFYDLCMTCNGRIIESMLLTGMLEQSSRIKICRLMNAANILNYVGFTTAYGFENMFIPLNDAYKLLTSDEVKRLGQLGFQRSNATREVILWVIKEIQRQYEEKRLTDVEKSVIIDQMLRFRSAASGLQNYRNLPFPFIYVHFVIFVSLIYPAVFAIAVAMGFKDQSFHLIPELVSIICVFINSAFVFGLRFIAHHFQDPFGNDLEDLNVLQFVEDTILSTKRLLASKLCKDENADKEIAEFWN